MQDPEIQIHKNDGIVSVSVTFPLIDSTDGGESSATYWIHATNEGDFEMEPDPCVAIEIEDEQQFDGHKSIYQNFLPESRLA